MNIKMGDLGIELLREFFRARGIDEVLVGGLGCIKNLVVSVGSERGISCMASDLKRCLGGLKQGTAESGWVAVDYGDIVVNIMSKEAKDRMNFEGLWNGDPDHGSIEETVDVVYLRKPDGYLPRKISKMIEKIDSKGMPSPRSRRVSRSLETYPTFVRKIG